jgi:hypothetical protein
VTANEISTASSAVRSGINERIAVTSLTEPKSITAFKVLLVLAVLTVGKKAEFSRYNGVTYPVHDLDIVLVRSALDFE